MSWWWMTCLLMIVRSVKAVSLLLPVKKALLLPFLMDFICTNTGLHSDRSLQQTFKSHVIRSCIPSLPF